jgi:dimeric dUTPase (all-alpha-NTP-PPase superfamily)
MAFPGGIPKGRALGTGCRPPPRDLAKSRGLLDLVIGQPWETSHGWAAGGKVKFKFSLPLSANVTGKLPETLATIRVQGMAFPGGIPKGGALWSAIPWRESRGRSPWDKSFFSLHLKKENNSGKFSNFSLKESRIMDRFERMFELQEQLNARVGVHVRDLSDEEKIEWILKYSRAIQQELAELVDSVPWKWWKKQQHFDEENAKVEVIDLMHFVISAGQVLGLSSDDFYNAYLKKNEINHRRQDAGY